VALDLSKLVAPGHTVLVTQELQGAVVGRQSPLAELVEAARPAVVNAARLAAAARSAGVPVVHCVAVRRSDGLAASDNARIFVAMTKAGADMRPGSDGAAVVPDLAVDDRDLVLSRYHGLGPMGGTDLDMVCRNLGATTIVGVGVSLNVGVLSLALDAVNAGYQFVLPRDAAAGVPPAYADAVVDNTIAVIGTVVDTDAVLEVWSRPQAGAQG
jgi:biuret amidohydrolase